MGAGAMGPRFLGDLVASLRLGVGRPLGAVRPETGLECFLGFIQRVLAVHQVEQELLVFLEAVVAQTDRVLDDVVRPPLILLRLDREIGAHAELHARRINEDHAEMARSRMARPRAAANDAKGAPGRRK